MTIQLRAEVVDKMAHEILKVIGKYTPMSAVEALCSLEAVKTSVLTTFIMEEMKKETVK